MNKIVFWIIENFFSEVYYKIYDKGYNDNATNNLLEE